MVRSSIRKKASSGFTLVELLIVMGIIAVLGGLATVNLFQPQTAATLSGTMDALLADIKSQQIKAMAGDSVSASSAQAHGVYLQGTTYTLFKGASYSAGDTDNFVVTAEPGVTISTTFPSTQLVFTKGSGEVSGFVNGSNTITLSGAGGTRVITLNRYGVTTIN